jgi:hypothetical protein
LTALEPGDRFEVTPSLDGRTLTLPANFLDLNQPLEQLEQLIGPDDRPQTVRLADSRTSL